MEIENQYEGKDSWHSILLSSLSGRGDSARAEQSHAARTRTRFTFLSSKFFYYTCRTFFNFHFTSYMLRNINLLPLIFQITSWSKYYYSVGAV